VPPTVHIPLKIIAFDANGIGRQAYGVRKLLQDLEIDMALFLETHLKLYMKLYIPNYDIYRTNGEDGHEDGTTVALKKGIPIRGLHTDWKH
jgi:hypothetical protein